MKTRIQARLDRLVDTLRFWHCRATMWTHAFTPDGDHCLRCDAVRIQFWGDWVILDG